MIDAHAHLDDPRFASDLDAVLSRAEAAGVTRILSCAEDLASSERNVALAVRAPSVRVAVGVHPHRAASFTAGVATRLRALAREAAVVAIGEIGVDLSGRSAPREVQIAAFRAQLELARELDLPAGVHVREAGDLAREVIDSVPGVRGMIHCYSEDPRQVEAWLARGFVLSFAGTVTYPKNGVLREAAARTPAGALLVETDAPYLAPQRHRGRRNEPALVAETLAAGATARGDTRASLAAAIQATAEALFGSRWA